MIYEKNNFLLYVSEIMLIDISYEMEYEVNYDLILNYRRSSKIQEKHFTEPKLILISKECSICP